MSDNNKRQTRENLNKLILQLIDSQHDRQENIKSARKKNNKMNHHNKDQTRENLLKKLMLQFIHSYHVKQENIK